MFLNIALWKKVFIGLILGIFLGLCLGDNVCYLKPFGDVFIKMIKMIIAPLVFLAIVGGITSVSDSHLLGRIGIKASIAYIVTTLFAVFIGFCSAWLIRPGEGVDLCFANYPLSKIPPGTATEKLLSTLMSIIPDNALGAMAEGTILQVVFFAIFTGITVHKMAPEQGKRIADVFRLLSSMLFKMIHIIIELSPYAACALTAWVIGTQGLNVLQSLAKLIFSLIFACTIQYGVFGLMILAFTRLSPWPFYKKSLEYQSIAFATSSSKAALSTTMDVCHRKLGMSKVSSSFVLPLGASINMDGMAINLGMCAIFFAQATGKILTLWDYSILLLTATLGSIGGAGIPGGSLVMLPMVLSSVGLPIEGVALIAGIDRILDMVRTTLNITGDAAVTLVVDHSEGQLDETIYYS